jgi:hypothetical protein
MLGLARHAQQAGWGAAGPNITVSIESESQVNYAVYQEPSFSMALGHSTFQDNEIDLTDYTDLAGYAFGKFTLAFNYYPDYSNLEYDPGEYLGNIGRFHIVSLSEDKDWFISCAAEITFDTNQLVLIFGTPDGGEDLRLPGPYTDWNGTWLYVVITASLSETDFTDWDQADDFPRTGNLYVRAVVYNQETGEFITKIDTRFDDSTLPAVTALDNPLLVKDPFNTTTDCYDVRVFASGEVGLKESLISQLWASFGTMWDPLSIDTAAESWITTRPNKQIGSAVAWSNHHFTDTVIEGTTPDRRYWVKMSGDDIYKDPNNTDKGLARFVDAAWQEENLDDESQVFDSVVDFDPIKSRG